MSENKEVDPRYGPDKVATTLESIETIRNKASQIMTVLSRDLAITAGFGVGKVRFPLTTAPGRHIASLGCGNAQVEQLIFGKGLNGIRTSFIGYDIAPTTTVQSTSSKVLFVPNTNILGMAESNIPGEVNTLLDIDASTVIPPAADNLDRYAELVSEFLTSRPNSEFIQINTFPASVQYAPKLYSDRDNPTAISKDLQGYLPKLTGGLYLLPHDYIEAVAGALVPTTDHDQLLKHWSTLHRKYTDSRGFFDPLMDPQIKNGTKIEAQLQALLDSSDLNDPYHSINLSFTTFHATIDKFIEASKKLPDTFIKHKANIIMISLLGLYLDTFQFHAYRTVMKKLFEDRGLKVDEIEKSGAVGDKTRSLPYSRELGILGPEDEDYADAIYWLNGTSSYVRRKREISEKIQVGQISALRVTANQTK